VSWQIEPTNAEQRSEAAVDPGVGSVELLPFPAILLRLPYVFPFSNHEFMSLPVMAIRSVRCV
jgi:hypothetical protein